MSHFDRNNPTKAQLTRIVKEAKNLLWDGKGNYCPSSKEVWGCGALYQATINLYPGTWDTPPILERMVKRHIGRHTFMSGFLQEMYGREAVQKAGTTFVQHYRRLMFDNMLKMIKEGDY